MPVRINEAALQARLKLLTAPRVEAGVKWVDKALSQEGSGIQHTFLPNRSSSPTEMPAEQYGHLKASIGSVQTGIGRYAIGSYSTNDAQGASEALELELRPTAVGGRPFLTMTLHDAEFHKALLTGEAP